jgi:hypothetical protein
MNIPADETRPNGKGTTIAARIARVGSGWWLAVAGVFWMAAVGCAIFMLQGPFPFGSALYVTYFIFALSTAICLHAVFLCLAAMAREDGKKLSKRVPKYIEYAYAALISTALAQVFFAGPQFTDYVNAVIGDKNDLLVKIKTIVDRHVTVDCLKRDSRFFTDAYCGKMKKVADAENPEEYILKHVVNDREFLKHPIMQIVTRGPRDGEIFVTEWPSQLGDVVDRLATKVAVNDTSASESPMKHIYGWIALIIFPIGVAMRLVKTTLELYVAMD